MFKKVLLAEDFQDTNLGIKASLQSKLGIPYIQDELFCDKAYNRLKIAQLNEEPFELLITDLYFAETYVKRRLTTGVDLIRAARKVQPNLKIIVNSMEDNPSKINYLFKEEKIDAYVCKGRNGSIELIKAIREVYHNRTYFSPQVNLDYSDNVFELDEFDLRILRDLAEGFSKRAIVERFRNMNISPNSESTLDKRVSKLFDEFGAKNTTHLIAMLTRDGRI